MKFKWFHIIGSKRFAKLVAAARRSGYEDEHRVSSRQMQALLEENAFLKLLVGKSKIRRKKRA